MEHGWGEGLGVPSHSCLPHAAPRSKEGDPAIQTAEAAPKSFAAPHRGPKTLCRGQRDPVTAPPLPFWEHAAPSLDRKHHEGNQDCVLPISSRPAGQE